MKYYKHIFYRDCPHFTVGRADQWGENGYLLYEEEVYYYMVDRKEQYSQVHTPRSKAEFLVYAQERQIDIPKDFLALLKA